MGYKSRTARTRLLLSAAAISILLPASSFAQGTNLLPAIDVIGTPTNMDAVYTTPSAVSSVSAQEINVLSRLDAVLRSQPGTFTRESLSNPGFAVNIRGFEGSGRVNMMIDGVTQNFRFTAHEGQGFVFVDSQLLAGIDIERGPVAGTSGVGTLAGTANFRTLDVDDVLIPGRNYGALTSLTYGTNGVGWREMVSGAARITPNFSVIGAIAYRNEGNYKNGNNQIVPFAGPQDLTSGLVKVNIAPTDNSTLRLGYRHYDNTFTASSFEQNVLNKTSTINYTLKPDSPLLDFKVNLGFNETEMQHIRRINTFVSLATEARNIKDRGITFNASNTSLLSLGSVAVKSENGFEFVGDRYTIVEGGVNPEGKSYVTGPFSKTTFRQGIFDLIVGVRYDIYSIKGSGALSETPPFMAAGPYTVDSSDGRLNPNITLSAKVMPWLQVYGKYAESLRAPTVNEVFLGGLHPGGANATFSPNPFLRPEVKRGPEVGLNVVRDNLFYNQDALRVKFAAFYDHVDDYVAACVVPNGSPPPATLNLFCNLAGTSIVSGVELQGSYDTGRWFTTFNYTYLNTDLPTQTPGIGASQYTPDHTGSVSLGARFFEQRLTAGGRVRYYSSAADPTYDPTFQVQRPGYTLLDVFASYKVTPTWVLSLTAENIANEAYTPILGTAPTTTTPLTPFTGETGRGRTILLNSRAQF
jgi:hemoglobin/transferrin/lactoferrin receptor protein